jgi:hypothetical protein
LPIDHVPHDEKHNLTYLSIRTLDGVAIGGAVGGVIGTAYDKPRTISQAKKAKQQPVYPLVAKMEEAAPLADRTYPEPPLRRLIHMRIDR